MHRLPRAFSPPSRSRPLALAAAGCSTMPESRRDAPDRSASRAAHARPIGGARWTSGASAIAPIRAIPKPRSATPRRCARSASARRRSPCSNRPSIHNPKNTALLGAYGRALADVGNYKQALDVLNRAHTPDQPDWRILSVQGAVLDQMGRHRGRAALLRQRAADRAGRAVGAVQSRPVLRAVQEPAAGGGDAAARRRAAAAPSRGCGRISRWWSACRAASQEAEDDRARPICRPTRRPPMSPICGRCWRSRAAGRSTSAARRWRRPPAPELLAGILHDRRAGRRCPASPSPGSRPGRE